MDPDLPAVQEQSFFENLLDRTCARLEAVKNRYTLRRLDELDAILGQLESELDELTRPVLIPELQD